VWIAVPGQQQRIQWAGGGTQVAVRQVQVDGRFFQITMPQQNLDGSQVRTGFE